MARAIPMGRKDAGRPAWTPLALVLVVLLIIAAVSGWRAIVREDAVVSPTSTTPPLPTTATATPTTTLSSTTTAVPSVPASSTAIWPFPGQPTYSSPDEAARSFAVDYLHFTQPILGAFEPGDTRSGEVPLAPKRGIAPTTTVLVRQLDRDEGWSVIGAVAADITLTTPEAFTEIASPVTLRGSALAFEGNVVVEVREDGELGAIGSSYVTGGGDVERPFEGSVAFETPGAPGGALVLFTQSAEDGRTWQALAMRVRFRSTDTDAAACDSYRSPRARPSDEQMETKVYFTCDAGGAARVIPVYRLVPRSPRVLEAALRGLLAGPNESERKADISSWFSSATAGFLRSVVITDGHAVVDLGDLSVVIPGASSSAGSSRLLAELDATVFQFPAVTSVEYRIDGSCERFNEWLQYGGCDARTRPPSSD